MKGLMEENGDAFETGRDEIFLAKEIVCQCVDISLRQGYLAMEEFVDSGCGVGKAAVPLWEYTGYFSAFWCRTKTWKLFGAYSQPILEQWEAEYPGQDGDAGEPEEGGQE